MIKQVWENGVLVEVVEIDSTTDKVLSRQTSRRELPCIHLGDYTGERILCPSCQGHVEVKLRKCKLHKICTTHKKVTGIECCSVGFCPDYVDQEGNRGKPLVNTLAQTKYLGLDPKTLIEGTRVEPLMGGSTLTFPFCGCCANPATTTVTCCPVPIPQSLVLRITNATGTFACLAGTYAIQWDSALSSWHTPFTLQIPCFVTVNWLEFFCQVVSVTPPDFGFVIADHCSAGLDLSPFASSTVCDSTNFSSQGTWSASSSVCMGTGAGSLNWKVTQF